ncbi:hypothetical protein MHU86_23229 [Fragilaria crotonensis]|nr:hypothetical protein MHU86_23229 [Fragilaria crotonensis]
MSRKVQSIPRWCRLLVIFLAVLVSVDLTLWYNYVFWLTSQQSPNMTSPMLLASDMMQFEKKPVPKKSIAYAISITSCPTNQTGAILDGPAVLGHSIHQVHSGSNYEYRLYAFVHPVALSCVIPLQHLGFTTLVRNIPFEVRDIQSESYRINVETHGCCGSLEFLKLWAYSLVEHELVVHIDTDVFFHKPIDHIFDRMLLGASPKNHSNSTLQIHPHNPDEPLPSQIDFLFTRDYHQQSTITTDPKRYGVQGGFFIVRPSLAVLDDMKSLLLKGEYSTQMGWGRAYHGGYWGAPQVQGFLSYYYTVLHPEHAVELNRCLYNTMLDNPMDRSGKCRTGEEVCQDCRQVALSDMFSIHLTLCWKPWQVSDGFRCVMATK